MLCPLYAPIRELYCRGIYCIDVAQLEARKPARVFRANESFVLLPEVVVHYPEELFHNRRIPCSVCIGERVQIGGRDSANAGKFFCVDLRYVHKLIEAEHMKELTEHQKIHLRIVRQLTSLDLFVLYQFRDLGVQFYFVDPFSPLADKGRADTLLIAPCYDFLSRGRNISLRLHFFA